MSRFPASTYLLIAPLSVDSALFIPHSADFVDGSGLEHARSRINPTSPVSVASFNPTAHRYKFAAEEAPIPAIKAFPVGPRGIMSDELVDAFSSLNPSRSTSAPPRSPITSTVPLKSKSKDSKEPKIRIKDMDRARTMSNNVLTSLTKKVQKVCTGSSGKASTGQQGNCCCGGTKCGAISELMSTPSVDDAIKELEIKDLMKQEMEERKEAEERVLLKHDRKQKEKDEKQRGKDIKKVEERAMKEKKQEVEREHQQEKALKKQEAKADKGPKEPSIVIAAFGSLKGKHKLKCVTSDVATTPFPSPIQEAPRPSREHVVTVFNDAERAQYDLLPPKVPHEFLKSPSGISIATSAPVFVPADSFAGSTRGHAHTVRPNLFGEIR